jgi:hypothetical protein
MHKIGGRRYREKNKEKKQKSQRKPQEKIITKNPTKKKDIYKKKTYIK